MRRPLTAEISDSHFWFADALDRSEVAGLVVRLPDWVYPVVVDVATGRAAYDDFEGR